MKNPGNKSRPARAAEDNEVRNSNFLVILPGLDEWMILL